MEEEKKSRPQHQRYRKKGKAKDLKRETEMDANRLSREKKERPPFFSLALFSSFSSEEIKWRIHLLEIAKPTFLVHFLLRYIAIRQF